MKEIGRKYQAIDACPNDHIIYNGQYGSKTNCPKCNYNRYQYDKITKKGSSKVSSSYSYNSMFVAIIQV